MQAGKTSQSVYSNSKETKTQKTTWKIIEKLTTDNNISKRYKLCIEKEIAIITYPKQDRIPRKTLKLIFKCMHEIQYLQPYHMPIK